MTTDVKPAGIEVAPGSVVQVRDEEWLVTAVTATADGQLLTVRGLSELVRDTTATFYESLDTITVVDPAQMTVVADDSPGYRRSRLWLEATLRKTALPVDDPSLVVSTQALADPLDYQHAAVRRALDPANLRPRVLLADAVGLGKTLEIGMILSELIRRGRGERLLEIERSCDMSCDNSRRSSACRGHPGPLVAMQTSAGHRPQRRQNRRSAGCDLRF
ncbi:MAG: hypothetical protein U0Q08_01640 [Dermatophilaceae bacterium]